MILFLLILLSGGCAVAALIADMVVLAYIAAAVSFVCVVLLGWAVWKGIGTRRETAEAPAVSEEASADPEEAEETVSAPEKVLADSDEVVAAAEEDLTDYEEEPVATADPAPVDYDSRDVVHVIPGRMRYHRAGCRLIEGTDHEPITLAEAHEEGFSQCSVCAQALPANPIETAVRLAP